MGYNYTFLTVVKFKDNMEYNEAMQKFTTDVAASRALGLKENSFMTQNVPGDGETFYLHALFHYLVPIAHDTLEKFNCGIGIWTMQGVEHVNKLSKSAFRNHVNGRGNTAGQSIKVLQANFINEMQKEILLT